MRNAFFSLLFIVALVGCEQSSVDGASQHDAGPRQKITFTFTYLS